MPLVFEGAPQAGINPWSGFALWEWIAAGALVLTLIAIDFIANRKPDPDPSIRKSAVFVGMYFGCAGLVAVYLFIAHGDAIGMQYVTGYLSEYSLSIDNLFAWEIMIFGAFNIWRGFHAHLIRVGMLATVAIRVVVLIFGAQAFQSWWWFGPFVLGPLLLYVTFKLFKDAFSHEKHAKRQGSVYDSKSYRRLGKVLPLSEDTYGTSFWVREGGKIVVGVFGVVWLAFVGLNGGFSLDSLPIIMTISQYMFIILLANVQSLLGLTSMYFLYDRISDKFHLLKFFLPLILAWMTFKTFAGSDLHHWVFEKVAWPEWHLHHDWVNLVIVAGLIGAGILVSIKFPPKVTHEPVTVDSDLDPVKA